MNSAWLKKKKKPLKKISTKFKSLKAHKKMLQVILMGQKSFCIMVWADETETAAFRDWRCKLLIPI